MLIKRGRSICGEQRINKFSPNSYISRYFNKKFLLTALGIFLLVFFFLIFSSGLAVAENDTEEIKFTILHTNDEHSALIPHSPAGDYDPETGNPGLDPTRGGFARLATAVQDIRFEKENQQEPVLLLNAGDFLGGSPFGWLALRSQAAELNLLQEIGYDVAIIGNHEFDYGPEILVEYLQQAGYPEAHQNTVLLASNMVPPEEHPLNTEGLYRKIEIRETAPGLTTGFFSLVGKHAVDVMADRGEVRFADQHQIAREKVDKLRSQGADIVIAVTHSGLEEDRDLAREVDGIDLIVGGHSHTAIEEPLEVNGTIIVQAGAYLEYLGHLPLAYNPGEGLLRVRQEEEYPFLISLDAEISPDPIVSSRVENYRIQLNELVTEMTGGQFEDIMDPAAYLDNKISSYPPAEETPAGNFVTDAMRLSLEEITGERVDLALQASGNIRKDFIPTREGQLTLYDTLEVAALGSGDDDYPGYPIVSFYLNGQEVRYLLELAAVMEDLMSDSYFINFSGLRYEYNPEDAILFEIPFLNLPLPSLRAVKKAEIYQGEGVQPGDENRGQNSISEAGLKGDFAPLAEEEDHLYHVVTDSYILSFLPLANDMLPGVKFEPKREDGTAVSLEEMEELKINYQDRELKVWETVVKYAAEGPDFDRNPAGDSVQISDYYQSTSGRINPRATFSLRNWLLAGLVGIIVLFSLFIWRRKSR